MSDEQGRNVIDGGNAINEAAGLRSNPAGPSQAVPNTASESPDASGCAQMLARVEEGLGLLLKRLDGHLVETAACSRSAFDRLHEEMRQYKDNFLASAERPVLMDVVLLYDSILKLKQHYEQAQSVELTSLLANLDGLLVEATEILARRNILPLCEPGDKLQLRTQRAVRTVPTADPAEDMQIVDRLKTGFAVGDGVFRREEVVIKKSRAAVATNAKS